ncbi:MAG: hypothetical protein FJ359_04405 [Thaumarchaeota archaeon]|nr:hypothetical protein [Nitrososphaerota archaeon]
MSKAKSVYVLSKGALTKLRNKGVKNCARCSKIFQTNNVVASSTTNILFCYDCASAINLVSGKIDEDFELGKFIPGYFENIDSITRAIRIDFDTTQLALQIIKKALQSHPLPSKNPLGFASAAIYYACKLNKYEIDKIVKQFPVSERVLIKNYSKLQHCLTPIPLIEGN